MHVGDRIPIAAPTSSLREAIVVMSNKALGCVFVVDSSGKLVGILTDGDLRRSLASHPNPLDDGLAQHMTAAPRFVTGGTLAAEAIRMMEHHSITVLPVLSTENIPVGAIHLHDLVQAGLA
jgi:arabinose-5-phosphate isomerase